MLKLATSVAILASLLTLAVALPARATTCLDYRPGSSMCTGSYATGTSVDLWGQVQVPASSQVVVHPPAALPAAVPVSDAGLLPRFQRDFSPVDCLIAPAPYSCAGTPDPAPAEPIWEVTYLPGVSLADLASFTPQPPTLMTEPGGWTIVGADTNLVAGAVTHTVAGELFGLQVWVRFTPQSYHWNFGDGAVSDTGSGGATWAALGRTEFAATPTSHRYGAAGSVTPSVTVEYSAAYQFGAAVDEAAWMPISGTVQASGAATPLVVTSARPLLVAGPCAHAAVGHGC
jgi:hypothetical protein